MFGSSRQGGEDRGVSDRLKFKGRHKFLEDSESGFYFKTSSKGSK